MTEIAMAELDHNLASDIAGVDPESLAGATLHEIGHGDAPNGRLQVFWCPAVRRAGIVYCGSGSSGQTSWTDADSAEDALRRYLEDEMAP